MQTLGIGVDIIENSRIKKSIINKNFINRVFSHEEITESKKKRNKISFFSKRFAAKEAFSKALYLKQALILNPQHVRKHIFQ